MKDRRDKFTFVFDIDDTICYTKKRNYLESKPDNEMIKKVNKLYDEGNKIILFTSRGMVSCNGNVEKAIEKNEGILRKWLEENNVKYNHLYFGKPIADFYIDDRCFTAREFKNAEFEILKGGKSGSNVYRLGNFVCKFVSDEKRKRIEDFEENKPKEIKTPKIVSNLYNKMYIEYIEGKSVIDLLSDGKYGKFSKIFFNDIDYLKNEKGLINEFKIENIFYKIELNINNCKEEYYEINDKELVENAKNIIKSVKKILEKNVSISHGDMIASNIMLNDKKLVYFDSEFDIECSTYIMDLSKMYMSILGYENIFGITTKEIDKKYAKRYYEDVKLRYGKKVCLAMVALTYQYIVRLIRYNKNQLESVKKLIDVLEENNGKQIRKLLKK